MSKRRWTIISLLAAFVMMMIPLTALAQSAKCSRGMKLVAKCNNPEECEKLRDEYIDACRNVSNNEYNRLLDLYKEHMRDDVLVSICQSCYYNHKCNDLLKYRKYYSIITGATFIDKNSGEKVGCASFADELKTALDEKERVGKIAAGTHYVSKTVDYSEKDLNAEFLKNKAIFDRAADKSRPLTAAEAKRAAAYAGEIMSDHVNKQKLFPIDFYLEQTFRKNLGAVYNYISKKYNCVCKVSGDLEKGDNTLEYCKSDEFVNACNELKALEKPGSDYAGKGLKLDYLHDVSYIVNEHDMFRMYNLKWVSLKSDRPRYLEHDSNGVTYPDSFYKKVNSMNLSFMDLFLMLTADINERFSYNPTKISDIYNKNRIENQEMINEELAELKDIYKKNIDDCHNVDTCKAFVLAEINRLRECAFMCEGVLGQPDLLPKNDDVILTKQLKDDIEKLKARLKGIPNALDKVVVLNADEIKAEKARRIAKWWETNTREAPESEFKDAEAEKVIKKEIESLSPKLKVTKVIFTAKWIQLEADGTPNYEVIGADVCIKDPDHKGKVLCSLYGIKIARYYQGGGKLVPKGKDSFGHMHYDYRGGGKFGKPEILSRGEDIHYQKYTSPSLWYTATNIK